MKLKVFFLIVMFLFFSQCKKKHMNNTNRIYYKTEEFLSFENNAQIKYDEANAIFLEYLKKEHIKLTPVFLFCEGEDYLFGVTTDPSQDKMNRSWKLYKLKVNSQSENTEPMQGQVKE
ncbi:hypothetical protein [Chryseobacterium sp.]|uniref:hypothetical protein n=1 Tax=Chryseobacterium sp. TaxID=1871047 RepID=UPI0023F44BF4|nr:hypothetical protein [Chryseobacterium sp.]